MMVSLDEGLLHATRGGAGVPVGQVLAPYVPRTLSTEPAYPRHCCYVLRVASIHMYVCICVHTELL